MWVSYGRSHENRQRGRGMSPGGRFRKKKSYSKRGHSRSGHMWTGGRRQWWSGWTYGLFLTFVKEGQVMREGVDSRCRGGGRRQRRII